MARRRLPPPRRRPRRARCFSSPTSPAHGSGPRPTWSPRRSRPPTPSSPPRTRRSVSSRSRDAAASTRASTWTRPRSTAPCTRTARRTSTSTRVSGPRSRIGPRDPLHFRVGHEELAVSTLDGRVVEKRVPLPERWVRGFAEVAVATSTLEPTLELSSTALRQFLEQLPRGGSRGVRWVVPSGTGARLSTRHAAGSARRRRDRTPPSPPRDGTVHPRGDRVRPSRRAGEPGRGLVLRVVSRRRRWPPRAHAQPRTLSGVLGGGWPALCILERSGHGRWKPRPRDVSGTTCGAPSGSHRELPFSRRTLDRPDGRLAKARELVASAAVVLTDDGCAAAVTSGSNEYRVRLVDGTWRCTCPWWGKHGDDRGPCKHILAAVIASTCV